MREIQLLDCTLRDGGYTNDWEFGYNNLISIYERQTNAGVDIIEIGFLDDRRPFDRNRSIMPDTKSAQMIWKESSARPPMVVGMIDFGTCSIENIQPCSESFLDGIRVIFKEHKMYEAMQFCADLKALGYKVFSQLVSITSYSDEKLMELIGLVNEVEPYAVSIVDTYGLLYPDDMLHYFHILDKYVKSFIRIGFHAHNNLQLAYANSLAFLEQKTKHNLVIDGTLYGMGKSAGNAPIELLAMWLNEKCGAAYRISEMLESIEESIMDLYMQSSWGYKIPFYLSSRNKCHPNYVSYYKAKQSLSVSKIDRILATIEPEDKKLLYDKLTAEQIYENYQRKNIQNDISKEHLKEELQNKKIVLVGPGKNIRLQGEKVKKYIEDNKPCVISVNYNPEEINVDYIFVTNSKRYHNIQIKSEKIIATSNVECRNGVFDFHVDREPLLDQGAKITDNSFLMLLQLLFSLGVRDVTCAGFDGYSEKEDNYFNPMMEYGFVKREAQELNRHMREVVLKFRENMKIEFLTYSAYDREEDMDSAAF